MTATREHVTAAVNAGADAITTGLNLDERVTDVSNLVVNAAFTSWSTREATFGDVVAANYTDMPGTVRRWWGRQPISPLLRVDTSCEEEHCCWPHRFSPSPKTLLISLDLASVPRSVVSPVTARSTPVPYERRLRPSVSTPRGRPRRT
ncbi:hypothetical protein LO763_20255 [Glycomyces sp. A-F 0318]|uniref:hypothetical protein n=1 Tax=Glycomyces amatae TaxID=2881355 RepID=UPI001E4E74F8|nr:hypothetical protein [Glycomyces amatae]MCD0445947.1 hypothetical protein [Glycomyces amatae]